MVHTCVHILLYFEIFCHSFATFFYELEAIKEKTKKIKKLGKDRREGVKK
eukprot:TRINITY_DN10984_c0_g1_i1.p1 TRINITY_DN10984_c0_g1~~TRINITY_DN10984_c0_g1_i1.p1  ORF type:complete len:50 (-),score=6.45 TRINITY_DN10984_c0_g1_i1:85-234(-)